MVLWGVIYILGRAIYSFLFKEEKDRIFSTFTMPRKPVVAQAYKIKDGTMYRSWDGMRVSENPSTILIYHEMQRRDMMKRLKKIVIHKGSARDT